MSPFDKPLVWLATLLTTPPLSQSARVEAGYLLRLLQKGVLLSMPQSRPMPSIGARCHELRIVDLDCTWRIFYRIDSDTIVIPYWIVKKTQATSKKDIDLCKKRLKMYDGCED